MSQDPRAKSIQQTMTAIETKEECNDEQEIRRLLDLAKVKIEGPLLMPLAKMTKLDLSNCNLSALPSGFAAAVPNLSVMFLSNNNFKEMPAVIGQCPKLQMVAFKNNGMESIHPDALQPMLRWLILTDNKLAQLPKEIGRCTALQKFMLSGNQLQELPETIAQCTNLELIRLASNQLREPPLQLLQLPNLHWVALSANPFLEGLKLQGSPERPLDVLHDIEEAVGEVLGQGAGGVTRRVDWNGRTVAVKTYNGAMTSDGLPEEERRISCAASALNCDCLIQVLGETAAGSLVMEYLDQYKALADPPSFNTCSRDIYASDSPQLQWEQAGKLVTGLLEALTKLHAVGINHGDFYGHNILVQAQDPTQVKLSDFGAAFFYDRQHDYGKLLERIELRAFAVLVEETHALLIDEGDILKELAATCRKEGSTFESVHSWWKQQQP
jgi:tRNA A-37 threonylcarbamoyl transferase component Bud32